MLSDMGVSVYRAHRIGMPTKGDKYYIDVLDQNGTWVVLNIEDLYEIHYPVRDTWRCAYGICRRLNGHKSR